MTPARSLFYPGVLLALLLVCYGGLFLLWLGDGHALYFAILTDLGVHPFDWPFVDTHAVLSSAQCHRAGIDILKSNPCDVLGRVSSYSPLWLDLTPRFVTTADTTIVGAMLGLAFLLMVPVVLRPAGRADLAWSLAASLSTMVVFAVERGNIDLVVFLLAAGAALLWGGGRIARGAAYALCLAAGLLKYYPLALLVTAARERLKSCLLIILAALVALDVFAVVYGERLTGALAIVPNRFSFFDVSGDFGAKDLPLGLAQLVAAAAPAASEIIALLLGLLGLAVMLFVLHRSRSARFAIDWTAPDSRCLVIGAVLIAGCFFAGQSIGYRGVHFLFIVPALVQWRRRAADRLLRGIFTLTLAAVLCVMWGECLRGIMNMALRRLALPTAAMAPPELVFWAVRELVWWWIASVLLAVIARFLTEAPAFRLGLTRGRGTSLRPTG